MVTRRPGVIATAIVLAITLSTTTLTAGGQAAQPAPATDWRRVQRLSARTHILLLLRTSQLAVERQVLRADADSLTVLNPAGMKKSSYSQELQDIVDREPDRLAATLETGLAMMTGALRIAPEGVFARGKKLMDLNQIVERIAKDDVLEIRASHHGSVAVGVLVGIAAGFGVAKWYVSRHPDVICYGCGVFPLGGALIGGFGVFGDNKAEAPVLYRKP